MNICIDVHKSFAGLISIYINTYIHLHIYTKYTKTKQENNQTSLTFVQHYLLGYFNKEEDIFNLWSVHVCVSAYVLADSVSAYWGGCDRGY